MCSTHINYNLSRCAQIRVITKLTNTEQYSKGKGKTNKISQQPDNWENCNDPDLVQEFPKKWWVESYYTVKVKVKKIGNTNNLKINGNNKPKR